MEKEAKLFRGALISIARLTGINIHTVRFWVKYGEPKHSKLTPTQQNELRAAIKSHLQVTKEYDCE
jgi:hypothetical protein